jgi:hypothetical protein
MSKANELVTAVQSLSNYPCDKLMGGSIVPTALTIKMTMTPNTTLADLSLDRIPESGFQ